MMRTLLIPAFLTMLPCLAAGQERYAPAIEDNSFLIEEAYNQEEGIIQHIFNAAATMDPASDIEMAFTQEWPVGSQRHQLSYTIPLSLAGVSHSRGAGNLLINYRYQWPGVGEHWAFAPRLSIILPTSAQGYQQQLDVPGWQVNLPVSGRISEAFVLHGNAGVTVLPAVAYRTSTGVDRTAALSSVVLGGSIIWLMTGDSNFMLELLWNRTTEPADTGDPVVRNGWTIDPGYRRAIDIGSLQIVPGIAFPVTITGSRVSTQLFLYLSFEHPI